MKTGPLKCPKCNQDLYIKKLGIQYLILKHYVNHIKARNTDLTVFRAFINDIGYASFIHFLNDVFSLFFINNYFVSLFSYDFFSPIKIEKMNILIAFFDNIFCSFLSLIAKHHLSHLL